MTDTSKMIRSLNESGTLDKYWTGSNFSSDVNRAKELSGGRALSVELRNAAQSALGDASLNSSRIISTKVFADSSEEASFNDKLTDLKKRSANTYNISTSLDVAGEDGSIDLSKVALLQQTKLANMQVEKQYMVKTVAESKKGKINDNNMVANYTSASELTTTTGLIK